MLRFTVSSLPEVARYLVDMLDNEILRGTQERDIWCHYRPSVSSVRPQVLHTKVNLIGNRGFTMHLEDRQHILSIRL